MSRSPSPVLRAATVGAGLAALGAAVVLATRPRFDFRDRVVLITGGSRGLGLVLARQCVARGARLVLAARDPLELDRARDELTRHGAEVLTIPCDVSVPAQVDALVLGAVEHFGQLDVVIHDAGEITVGPLDTMTREDFERAMATHFWAALDLVRAALPVLRGQGAGGRIAFVSSVGGVVGVPHMAPYVASKFALRGFGQALYAELAQEGIAVTTACPWLMRTGSPRNALFKGQHRSEHAWFALSDSLPLLSMDAARAARRILAAVARGAPFVGPGAQTRLAAAANGLFPGLVSRALALTNRALPAPGGIGTEARPGYESSSPAAPGVFTALSERAAQANNEVLPGVPPRA